MRCLYNLTEKRCRGAKYLQAQNNLQFQPYFNGVDVNCLSTNNAVFVPPADGFALIIPCPAE